mgnify:CR=1 FL=1
MIAAMTHAQIVKFFGGGNASEAARKLQVSRQTLNAWKRQVPRGWQAIIQLRTGGELRAGK